jgi:hypothetical protein
VVTNCLAQEDAIPIPLTQAKGKSLTTLHLEYINDLPEYPESHIHGYTYVVSAGTRSQVEMEQMVHDVSNCKPLANHLLTGLGSILKVSAVFTETTNLLPVS